MLSTTGTTLCRVALHNGHRTAISRKPRSDQALSLRARCDALAEAADGAQGADDVAAVLVGPIRARSHALE